MIRYSSLKNTVEEAMRKLFNPEFLNRVDETIVFRNLEKEDIFENYRHRFERDI